MDVEGRGPTYGPIESIGSVRDAIRAAVDKGIVVVEPAGNGNMDLADMGVSYLQGQTAPGHSGALIVGAGGSDQAATGPSSRRRAAGSNYGSRVDLQGVGVGVVTSGYGDGLGGADDRAYTSCFDGTSSASATVAAAVAALQSGAKAQNAGAALTPGQVRSLLLETGLTQTAQEEGVIGPRPQVDLALARLAGAPPPAGPGPAVRPARRLHRLRAGRPRRAERPHGEGEAARGVEGHGALRQGGRPADDPPPGPREGREGHRRRPRREGGARKGRAAEGEARPVRRGGHAAGAAAGALQAPEGGRGRGKARDRPGHHALGGAHQPQVPGAPLNGPTTSSVIQPP